MSAIRHECNQSKFHQSSIMFFIFSIHNSFKYPIIFWFLSNTAYSRENMIQVSIKWRSDWFHCVIVSIIRIYLKKNWLFNYWLFSEKLCATKWLLVPRNVTFFVSVSKRNLSCWSIDFIVLKSIWSSVFIRCLLQFSLALRRRTRVKIFS